jgi:hypothetical protein
MKHDALQLQFLKDLFLTHGKADCPDEYNRLEYRCINHNDCKCPVKKYSHGNDKRCSYSSAYKAAERILEKYHPIEYLECVLKKEIK